MSQLFTGTNPLVDGTVSGVNDGVYNRLAVSCAPTGGVQATAAPYATASAAQTVWMPLTNNGSANMLVNGSASAPVVFQWPTAAPTKSFVISVAKVVLSASALVFNGASITTQTTTLGLGVTSKSLPNGILFQVTSGGKTTTCARVQITEDFYAFNGSQSVLAGDTGKLLVATMALYQPVLAGSTDNFSVAIQDMMANLTNLQLLRAYVGGVVTG